MNKVEAISAFWKSFVWPAYDESTVPDRRYDTETESIIKLEPPYITFNIVLDSFGSPVALTASLWDRSTSWTTVNNKALEIEREIGYGGKIMRYEDGYLWVKRGHPFSQRMADEDDSIRRIYINIEVEYLSEN